MTEPQKVIEKHTIHLANGTYIVAEGDTFSIHLNNPIVVQRKHWIVGLSPPTEVRKTLYPSDMRAIEEALEAAFRAVPQTIYKES